MARIPRSSSTRRRHRVILDGVQSNRSPSAFGSRLRLSGNSVEVYASVEDATPRSGFLRETLGVDMAMPEYSMVIPYGVSVGVQWRVAYRGRSYKVVHVHDRTTTLSRYLFLGLLTD